MNKGKVRDNAQLQHKKELINNILILKGYSYYRAKTSNSKYLKQLNSKSGGELDKILTNLRRQVCR